MSLSVGLFGLAAPSLAQTPSDPKAAAEGFLTALDSGDPGATYDKWVAERAKAFVSRDAFVQGINVFRIQSGGPAQSRLFVGGTPINQIPNGPTGDFYYLRYRQGYSSSPLFFDVTLERVNQSWLVLNYNFSPAP